MERFVAIIAKLSPKVVKKVANIAISSIESSSPIKIARELDKPIKFQLDKLLKHIKDTSYLLYEVSLF